MKTHIDIDEKLLKQVMELGGLTTKRAAVQAALTQYANLLARQGLLAMRGKVEWIGDLDQMRASRVGRPNDPGR
ncbi:MAG: type II toxin-antitoxin system VapB family antitoxin [Proteobacteria bacterium]|nr:type II toxin-antitoxin system VapB family antitoxin [Pseudomonadota bacterium]